MFHRLSALVFVAVVAGLSAPAEAQDEEANQFDFTLDARARVEQVDQDNLLQDATASTLRLRVGLETPSRRGLSALAEIEAVEIVGSEDFNSGSNGRTDFSTVLDPEDAELNQLVVRYLDGSHYLQVGRQRMVLDNARFFGDVGYRQNQQTYDAVSYMNTALQGQQFRYAYMSRARRFLSDENPLGEIDMNSHLLNYRLQRLNGDAFTAYTYLIDMDTPAVVQNSTQTFGLRYSGTYATTAADLLYIVEYAKQSDHADGASTNDADYVAVELGVKFKNEWLAQIGQERLGGDGVYGFQTPFGGNHTFNGLADVFAAQTPATGLVDSYAKLVVPVFGARILLAAHSFDADQGSADHGSELNLQVEKRFAERFGINLMVADYRADNFAVDTTKWALWVDFRY